MTAATLTQHEARAHALAEKLIEFLETSEVPDGLFAADVFCDFTKPTWRLQARGVEDGVALRLAGHPGQGRAPRWRFDPTPTGFVLEVEEAWDSGGEHWTCRELFRADIGDEGIIELSVYCTGDWDAARRAEHAAAVTLIRPLRRQRRRTNSYAVRVGEFQDDSAWEAARAAHCDAFVAARAADDVDAMAAAALGLASLQRFGGPGGRTPALLHEAYLAAADSPTTRARLAAALARSWVYGNDAARGASFALEAVELAEEAHDPTVLADALDAQLATSWGPDDLSERLHITARLQDVAAHVDDVRTRMDAHLWRLTTALETLDVTGMHRQLAALDLLAGETGSPLVRYFAMTRRAMHATLVDDLDRARELVEAAYALGVDIGVPDALAVYHEQRAEIARHADDVDFLAGEAALAEDYAVRHGIESVIAEAAVLALQAGDTERASRLVAQLAGGGFGQVPYDVDWLLTVSKTTEAAAGLGYTDIARAGMTLMAPYAGRCVVNAGAVVCAGVVEDYLWRAAVVSADPRADDFRGAAGTAYRRLDAPWWLRRVSAPYDVKRGAPVAAPGPVDRRTVEMRPLPGQSVWSVGPAGQARLLPDMKGLHYLRALLQRPGVEITALEMSAMVAGHGTAVAEPGAGERLDRRALTAYRNRLREIDEELDETQSWNDPARAERIEAEREALLRELAGATGLGGRARSVGGTGERARVAVRKAIAAALDRIDATDPATARLLRRTTHTGSVCRYEQDPDTPVDWLL